MNCSEARAMWHDRLDEVHRDARLDQHLAQCEPCDRYCKDMDEIVGALDSLRLETEGVISTVRPGDTAKKRKEPSRKWRRPAILLRVAAALAFTVTLGLYFGRMVAITDTDVEPSDKVVLRPPDHDNAGPTSHNPPSLGITLGKASAERMMAVALPTSNPNVQMYRVYPKRKFVRRQPL